MDKDVLLIQENARNFSEIVTNAASSELQTVLANLRLGMEAAFVLADSAVKH